MGQDEYRDSKFNPIPNFYSGIFGQVGSLPSYLLLTVTGEEYSPQAS